MILPRRQFLSLFPLLLCGQNRPPSKVGKAWADFVTLFNASPALREVTVHVNGINEGAQKVNQYETGRLADAGEEKKQVLDAMKADYAAVRRLLPQVDKELESELKALELVR